MHRGVLRLAAVLLPLTAGFVVGGARPAHAECVAVDAYVFWEDDDRPTWWYPLGGPDECVLPTPWQQRFHPHERVDQDFTFVPECAPDAVYVEVAVPLP